jgi:hydroxymethylpyrimidine pyrophosphatase-like HAD family hydrolase
VRFRCLATDYDGTLADKGRVTESTCEALRRLAASGWRLVLVTGRTLSDIQRVFPQLALMDRVVAENGALLYAPASGTMRTLAKPPPRALVESLRRRGVKTLEIGHVIVSTRDTYEREVGQALDALDVALEVIRNKDALMILPPGVDKATGLAAALTELNLPPAETVAVGDAENDAVMLACCGYGVAVANALPALKTSADWVTPGESGRGIVELVDRLLASDAVPG